MNIRTFCHAVWVSLVGICAIGLTSCTGIFDDIYDKPQNELTPAKGQLIVDATSWTNWYYIDLKHLQQLTEAGDEAGLANTDDAYRRGRRPLGTVPLLV